MSLLPDFNLTWLLRSVRGEIFSVHSNPILVINRLNALRPLGDADKDALLGAILSLGPSLQMALTMLLELLPQDESRERLGEVLCPTLGQLHKLLTLTLTSFERRGVGNIGGGKGLERGERGKKARSEPRTPKRPATARDVPSIRVEEERRPHTARPEFPMPPPFGMGMNLGMGVGMGMGMGGLGTVFERRDPAADLALQKELRAEMRVNAAIQVAVDSLEFAEGQLRIVKEVNRLSGGSFELLQRHFYEGYNRILFRALELERREFDSPPYAASVADPEPAASESQGATEETHHQLSVSFDSPVALPPLPPMGSPKRSPVAPRRYLTRRNTAQGIAEKDALRGEQKAKLKRRLSLAEELALADDDDDDDDYSGSGGGESDDEQDEGMTDSNPNLKQQSESESSEAESEDSEEEEPGHSESPAGDSESEDTSMGEDDESEGDDDETTPPAVPPTAANALQKDGISVRVKRLETRVAVISPPTSPERQPVASTDSEVD
ncbi:hypothetical protein OQA88_5551 [Cercophora sp. LCS_1]